MSKRKIYIEKGRNLNFYYNYDVECKKNKNKIEENKIVRNSNINLNTSTPTTTLPKSKFYGHCYYCDYDKHSQNYCPLRFCYKCNKYGHSEKVCPRKFESNNWREQSRYSRTNPKLNTQTNLTLQNYILNQGILQNNLNLQTNITSSFFRLKQKIRKSKFKQFGFKCFIFNRWKQKK